MVCPCALELRPHDSHYQALRNFLFHMVQTGLSSILLHVRGGKHRNSQNLPLSPSQRFHCVVETISLLMELHEARRRAHINKSLNQIIIDALLAAPAPEPGQTNAPRRELLSSHPGSQWLPCGCSLELLKNGD